MKVLITGGAGFIGSNYADRLLHQDSQVLVIDNYTTSRRDSLKHQNNLRIVEGSITDLELMTSIFEEFNPEYVIHSAASYKDPDDWINDAEVNINGTIHTVNLSMKHQVKRFVYLQTALCYGRPREKPITLEHALNPITSYSITKTAGEKFVVLSGLPYVSLRLANVYGPRHFSGPMPTFYKRLKAGKNCFVVDTRRDFIDIEDLFKLMDAVIEGKGKDGCFNVSSGKDHSIKEVFDLMIEFMKIELDEPVEVVPPGEDDVSSLLLDPSETEKNFGWKAEILVRDGLDNLIKWYEDNEVEETYTHLQIDKSNIE